MTDQIQVCDSKFWPRHPWVLHVCLLKDAREERRLTAILISFRLWDVISRGPDLENERKGEGLHRGRQRPATPTRPAQTIERSGLSSAPVRRSAHPRVFPSALSGAMRASSARASEQEPSCFCGASEDAFCFSLKASGSYKSNRKRSRVYFPVWIRDSVSVCPGLFGSLHRVLAVGP